MAPEKLILNEVSFLATVLIPDKPNEFGYHRAFREKYKIYRRYINEIYCRYIAQEILKESRDHR